MYRPPGTNATVGGLGTLAVTGSTVGWWIALGIVVLIAGVFLVHAARRRAYVDPTGLDDRQH